MVRDRVAIQPVHGLPPQVAEGSLIKFVFGWRAERVQNEELTAELIMDLRGGNAEAPGAGIVTTVTVSNRRTDNDVESIILARHQRCGLAERFDFPPSKHRSSVQCATAIKLTQSLT